MESRFWLALQHQRYVGYGYLVILGTEYTKIFSTLGITLIRCQKQTAQSGVWTLESAAQQSQLTANNGGERTLRRASVQSPDLI